MTLKIFNAILILFALYMGIKQGTAMLAGKPEMTEMFSRWNFHKGAVVVLGIFTIAGALLVLFPKTFIWGNFITAACILLLIVFYVSNKDMKGAVGELPFFFLSLLILYLQHPLTGP